MPEAMVSYKNKFAFSLAVPSWLFAGSYLENVSRVAPFVDGVELLFFEGAQSSLPDDATLSGLKRLKEEHGLSFNIHMPTDLSLSSFKKSQRQKAVDEHLRLMEMVAELDPVTPTIHLACEKKGEEKRWVDAAGEGLFKLASHWDPTAFTVETLDTDLRQLAPAISSLGFFVCLDLGHLIHFGLPVEETIKAFFSRCRMVHLHGVAGGKDHRSLLEMEKVQLERLLPFLKEYTHTLSVEIFKADPCFDSIKLLLQSIENFSL